MSAHVHYVSITLGFESQKPDLSHIALIIQPSHLRQARVDNGSRNIGKTLWGISSIRKRTFRPGHQATLRDAESCGRR